MREVARHSVLLIERNALMAQCLAERLRGFGYAVTCIESTWMHGLSNAALHDAVVLGGMDAGLQPEAVVRQLRHAGVAAPIVALVATDDVDRKIALLDAGVDACLGHPVNVNELSIRLMGCLRMSERKSKGRSIAWQDLKVDLDRMTVARGGRMLPVTPTGLRILVALMREAPRVVRRSDLCRAVWHGADVPTEGSLRSHVCQLRAAVDRGHRTALIQTVRQAGYRMTPLGSRTLAVGDALMALTAQALPPEPHQDRYADGVAWNARWTSTPHARTPHIAKGVASQTLHPTPSSIR